MLLDQEFWNKKYHEKETGWDLGYASTPLKAYVDQLTDKNMRILIPGCGNAYEGEYLVKKGFRNTFVMDISPVVLDFFRKRVPHFPKENIICEDFFHHQGQYDLILEQTFFCAIHPTWRKRYAEHCLALLKTGGKLAGVLFDDELNIDQPPYGGSKDEYLKYFASHFEIVRFERAFNSIQPRENRELFMILKKRPGPGA